MKTFLLLAGLLPAPLTSLRVVIRKGLDLCVDILNERRWSRDFGRAAKAGSRFKTDRIQVEDDFDAAPFLG